MVSSSARPVYARSTARGSAAANLLAAARRTSCSQEALKANATLGDCEHNELLMSFSHFIFWIKYRKLICSQYMRTTSVLVSVSLSLSFYCSYLIFFFTDIVLTSVFLNYVYKVNSPAVELSCWCTLINCT